MEVEAARTTAPEATATTAAPKRKAVDMDYVPPLLVPIANPLADQKLAAKVFKLVSKATKDKKIRRGVKEVVKSLRKSSRDSEKTLRRLCVIAGDITPIDVITHIPVLCEENSVPYLFVRSRAALGAAALTKRPTSVVMVALDPNSAHEKLFNRCHAKVLAVQPSFA